MAETCNHPDRFHGKGVPPMCFQCWRAANAARRQATRDELASLLAFGVHILEAWPSGRSIEWSMTPDGQTNTVHRSDIGGKGSELRSAQTNAYPSTRWNAAALAEHLEARAYGFGFELRPYCINCGEHLAELKTPAADATADPDPVCRDCRERLEQGSREAWEESHGREV